MAQLHSSDTPESNSKGPHTIRALPWRGKTVQEGKGYIIEEKHETSTSAKQNNNASASSPGSFAYSLPNAIPITEPTGSETYTALLLSIEEKEKRLREMAIHEMAQRLASKPNGTSTLPPTWYRCPGNTTSTPAPIISNRPRVWIKDWDTGKIRPRRMMDDFRETEMEKEKAKAQKTETVTEAQLDTTRKARSRKRKAAAYDDDDTDSGYDAAGWLQFSREERRCLAASRNAASISAIINQYIVYDHPRDESAYDADEDSDMTTSS